MGAYDPTPLSQRSIAASTVNSRPGRNSVSYDRDQVAVRVKRLFDQPHEARRVVREAPTWLASSNWTVVDRARWAMNRCRAGSMARSSAQAAYHDRTRRSWPPLGLRREVPPVVLRTARRRAIRAEHGGWLLRKGVRPRCPLAPSGSSPPCGAAPLAASHIRSAVDAVVVLTRPVGPGARGRIGTCGMSARGRG